MDLSPGVVVDDRYELTAPIRALGLTSLWRARDVDVRTRECVIEVLRLAPDGAPPAVLLDHLRRLRSLRHRSVLALQGHGFWESHPYLVLAPFEGVSLREHIAARSLANGGRAALAEVDALFRSIAEALTVAHASEPPLVHGDLGPDVVAVSTRDGEPSVCLVDLGLGAFVDARKDLEQSDFVAPERSPHARPEVSADVFSLARLLRFMLDPSGQRRGDRLRESTLRDDVSDEVWKAIERACAPHPRQRPQRVSELVDAIAVAWKAPVKIPSPAPVVSVGAPVESAFVVAPPINESAASPSATVASENPWATDVRMRRVELPEGFGASDDATDVIAPVRAATAAYEAPEGFERTEQISSQTYRAYGLASAPDEPTMQRAPVTAPSREPHDEETAQMAPVKFAPASAQQAPSTRVETTEERSKVAKAPPPIVVVAAVVGGFAVIGLLASLLLSR